jgi:hypothetical protein
MANPSPPPGTTAVMILRNSQNGDYEIYDIGNNSLLAAYFLGQVGLDWQPAGGLVEVDSQPVGVRLNGSSQTSLGHFAGSDTSDMMLRNAGSGQFASTISATTTSPVPPCWARSSPIRRLPASAISTAIPLAT